MNRFDRQAILERPRYFSDVQGSDHRGIQVCEENPITFHYSE